MQIYFTDVKGFAQLLMIIFLKLKIVLPLFKKLCNTKIIKQRVQRLQRVNLLSWSSK